MFEEGSSSNIRLARMLNLYTRRALILWVSSWRNRRCALTLDALSIGKNGGDFAIDVSVFALTKFEFGGHCM